MRAFIDDNKLSREAVGAAQSPTAASVCSNSDEDAGEDPDYLMVKAAALPTMGANFQVK